MKIGKLLCLEDMHAYLKVSVIKLEYTPEINYIRLNRANL